MLPMGPKPPPAPPPAHLLATPERWPDRRLGVQATPKRPAAPPTDGRRQAFPQLTKPKGEAENGNGCHTRKGPDTEQPQEERAAQRLDDKNFGVSPRTRLLAQTPKAFSKVAAAAKILKAEAEAAPPAAKKAKPPPAPGRAAPSRRHPGSPAARLRAEERRPESVVRPHPQRRARRRAGGAADARPARARRPRPRRGERPRQRRRAQRAERKFSPVGTKCHVISRQMTRF